MEASQFAGSLPSESSSAAAFAVGASHWLGVRRVLIGYDLAQNTFALILLVAAGLKATDLWPVSLAFAPPNWPAALALLTISIEWSLATWLLTGVARKHSRRAAMSVLWVFIAVAGWRLITRSADCGCFGRIHVPPAWTLSLDVASVIALYRLGQRSYAGPILQAPRFSRVVFAILLSFCIPALVVALAHRRAPLLVLIDPASVTGKPLPLLPYLDEAARSDLGSGRRTVILFNRDCEGCRRYLLQEARAVPSQYADTVRLIDTSPGKAPQPRETPFRQLQLSPNVECVCTVPTTLELRDGVVETVLQESSVR